MKELKNFIKKLKNKCGSDGIDTKIFRDIFEVMGNRMLDIVNTSLDYGVFPESWKVSVIIPIQKVNNTSLCEQFRGVHTVPIYEKVLEMVVRDQLLKFLVENNVIFDGQSGFRANHSCETSVVYIYNEWARNTDKNKIVLAVFVDFRRAFETINRDLLIKKLKKMGIGGAVLDWFTSYLTGRKQRVNFGGEVSSSIENNDGVPQGTTLGNLLFIVYINDIVKYRKHCILRMFADDTMIYIIGDDIDMLVARMNEDLETLNEWMGDNQMVVNFEKSHYMLFGNESKIKQINKSNIMVSVGGKRLSGVESIKYLGVKLDGNLTLKEHSEFISAKMAQKIHFISRISNKIDLKTRVLLFKSMVLPHLDFCTSLLFNLKSNSIEKIQKVINRGMRIVLSCNKRTPIRIMLDALNLMTVKQRIMFKTLDFIYKVEHRMLPDYLCEHIRYTSDIHKHQTRNRNNFYVETFRTSITSGSTLIGGLKIYNRLPREMKRCTNYRVFKRLLISHVGEHF